MFARTKWFAGAALAMAAAGFTMAEVQNGVMAGGGAVLNDGTVVVIGEFAIGTVGGAAEVGQGAVPCWFSAACPGDVDGNGQIGLSDLSTLLSNFGTPSGAGPEQGDLDDDGDVDLQDLAGLLAVFGSACP